MTREEAIDWLCRLKSEIKIFMPYQWQKPFEKALDMAIKALEQEPCCNCIEFKRYAKEMGFEIEQEPILDKIRAEIEELQRAMLYASKVEFNDIYKIFDKYKAESEG